MGRPDLARPRLPRTAPGRGRRPPAAARRVRLPRPRPGSRPRRRAAPAHRVDRRHRTPHVRARHAHRPRARARGRAAGLTVTARGRRPVVEAAGAEKPAWLAPLPRVPRSTGSRSGGPAATSSSRSAPTPRSRSPTPSAGSSPSAGDLASLRWVQRGFREPYSGPGSPPRCATFSARSTAPSSRRRRAPTTTCCGSGATPRPALAGRRQLDGRASDRHGPRRLGRGRPAWPGRTPSVAGSPTGAPLTAPTGPAPTRRRTSRATNAAGFPVIDDVAHLRRAHAPQRRTSGSCAGPYSYDDAPAGRRELRQRAHLRHLPGRPGAPVPPRPGAARRGRPAQPVDDPGRLGGLRRPPGARGARSSARRCSPEAERTRPGPPPRPVGRHHRRGSVCRRARGPRTASRRAALSRAASRASRTSR